MRRYACSFDWDRVLNTCDPEYYKWTQWFFLQMYERGLAYRKDSAVNWCPTCQTVLANEQTVSESGEKGVCVRCGTKVIQRDLNQWFFKITEFEECSIELEIVHYFCMVLLKIFPVENFVVFQIDLYFLVHFT
jgi:leucyl-tRNA synthetase